MTSCAACGKKEDEAAVKLKKCSACGLVNYCSVVCQKKHRSQHKRSCKKRAAEIRDGILFKQPESTHLGDCPICILPLPFALNSEEYTVKSCCSKRICHGCTWAQHCSVNTSDRANTCPFCRQITPKSSAGVIDNYKKRCEANDPVALHEVGMHYFREGNSNRAMQYWGRAAEMGNPAAHYELSVAYYEGDMVQRDRKKEKYHLEEAAIGGHMHARNNLAIHEMGHGNIDRAIKHFLIAACQGHNEALATIRYYYEKKAITKEQYEAALRGHHAAVQATKSPQREAGVQALRRRH